ncbi:hypothetical protein ACM75G_06355 [Pseudomonas aeruginosa]|nr:hypothetical protein [Pseudomonas aeruginosa]
MGFHRFMTFDPFLTFAEGERGFLEKIFLCADGSPTEAAWYGKEHDGKGYLSSLWRIGRDAYSSITEKLGEQPSTAFFEATAKNIQELEKELVPVLQNLVESDVLHLLEERDDPPVTDIRRVIEDAPDGWLTEVYMRIVMPSVVSGDIAEEDAPDFEELLLVTAVMYLDDCIIADQVGRAKDDAFELVSVNVASAKLYRQSIIAAKEALSAAGRRSASARHQTTNKQKNAALREWVEYGEKVSSMAAFARARHKDFGVTERTLYGWIRSHRKAKS